VTVTIDARELEALVKRLVAEALEEATAPARDEYLSTADAANLAGVAMGTIRRWIREGKLPPHRAGRELRVRRPDLERLMREPRRSEPSRELTPEELAERDFRRGG
jgi:excisionase family DNA binding protein